MKIFRIAYIFHSIALLLPLIIFSLAAAQDKTEMVRFPKGEFLMGSPEDQGLSDEHPQHKVYLDEFFLDRFEVSGDDFKEFLKANPNEHPTITGWYDRVPRPGMAKRPVIGLSWKRCRNYCEWRGKRLPTEAEWERAAAGLEGRIFPWGNVPPDQERANFGRCCFIRKGEVLEEVNAYSKGQTPDGIFNMSGNIAEWVLDWYDSSYYKTSPYKNPKGPETGKYHVVRGGAWNSLPDYMRSRRRYGNNDGQDFYGIGCRCALTQE